MERALCRQRDTIGCLDCSKVDDCTKIFKKGIKTIFRVPRPTEIHFMREENHYEFVMIPINYRGTAKALKKIGFDTLTNMDWRKNYFDDLEYQHTAPVANLWKTVFVITNMKGIR